MDMLDLEKLLEHTEMVNKISEDVVDEQEYNAVTKSINESTSQDTTTNVGNVISNGDKLNDKVNLDLLESQVNGALGLNESKLDPVGEEDADVNNDGKVDETDDYLKNRREKISKEMDKDEKKEKVMEGATELADIPYNTGKPAVGVDSATKFQQAVAVKQSEFVNANTEHHVSETAEAKEIADTADKTMDAMRVGADDMVKAGLNDGGQNVPDKLVPKSDVVTESEDGKMKNDEMSGEIKKGEDEVVEDFEGKDKMRDGAYQMIAASEVGKPNDEWKKGAMAFKTFVESLKDGQNDKHMNAVLEAFELISNKY